MKRSNTAVTRRQRDESSAVAEHRSAPAVTDRPARPLPRITTTMGPESALRDEGATVPCPVCDVGFVASGRRRYCSDRCRCRAWRRRRRPAPVPVVVPPAGPGRRAITIYECAACGTRSLGDQRCEDCGSFMARVGVGGLCPHCYEPVAVRDLVEEALSPVVASTSGEPPARRASTTSRRPAAAPTGRKQR